MEDIKKDIIEINTQFIENRLSLCDMRDYQEYVVGFWILLSQSKFYSPEKHVRRLKEYLDEHSSSNLLSKYRTDPYFLRTPSANFLYDLNIIQTQYMEKTLPEEQIQDYENNVIGFREVAFTNYITAEDRRYSGCSGYLRSIYKYFDEHSDSKYLREIREKYF